MDFSAAELLSLDGDSQQLAVFFRMALEPTPIRLWLGVGQFDMEGFDLVHDLDGAIYQGFGELGSAPIFQQLINGAAERIEFTLSGTSSAVMALATVEADTVKRKAVALGIGLMDNRWRMIGNVHWVWRGTGDFVATNITGASSPQGQTIRTIKLSAGSGMTGRKRRGFAYWTDVDFSFDHPGDKFCERTIKYSQAIAKVWPRF